MFFVVSKAVWLFVQPVSLILLLIVLGLILLFWRRRKSAIAAFGLAAGLQALLGFTSLGYLLIQPLEDRFARPAERPAEVGAIVMLGGATMARPSTARQIVELNQGGDRLTTTLWLAQAYPEARIVLSGGGGFLSSDIESEAETVRRFLLDMGIAEARLMLEGESRNTAENAAFTRQLLDLVEGDILLVTSAFHMPRSVGIYEMEGIKVVPWPTDYRSTGSQRFKIDLAEPMHNLETATIAIREWVGLVAYYATGRTGTLFPGP